MLCTFLYGMTVVLLHYHNPKGWIILAIALVIEVVSFIWVIKGMEVKEEIT